MKYNNSVHANQTTTESHPLMGDGIIKKEFKLECTAQIVDPGVNTPVSARSCGYSTAGIPGKGWPDASRC